MNNSSIFFNHSFDKKRLKTLVSWVLKNFGEQEALRVIELLKETGFHHATQAGISIGLHDLTTPFQKPSLVSNCEMTMNRTHQDFSGARITASERSQRIIDTWHRASDSLRKQVVDHFKNYDPFNPVYIMALSGARGNFSQVRQLIGMRGLMADQQGKIVSFPIRSNLREGLTLTEYFISCSGARKGLVDTALRTADTGYLTRRLVDVSHHVVVKRVRCNTHRKISVRPLYSYNKILLTLKERLIGRVLAEDVLAMPSHLLPVSERRPNSCLQNLSGGKGSSLTKRISSSCKFENSLSSLAAQDVNRNNVKDQNHVPSTASVNKAKLSLILAKKDQEISAELASQIELVRQEVYIRSPLTCQFTDSVCQLCYGWSMSQGDLVPLGDAVGVIAAQSIGEPGTQLTMRTFHTGGVFSGDLLQEIRAPHAGRVSFSQAFQGLVIRTAQGRIAFLTKISGELVLTPLLKSSPFQNQTLLVSHGHSLDSRIPIPALTMLFVRQGERVEKNQLLAEFSIVTQEGNQPVKSKQTLFAELSGKVIEQRTGATYVRELEEDGIEEEEDPFKFIEPRRSGRLGFFQIIAARVGATFSYKHPIVSLKKNSNQDLLKKRSNSSVRPSLFLNQASTSYGGKLDRDKNNLLEHPQKTGFAWKKTRVKPLLRYPRRKKWSKKYLHPEFVKSNAFCLETIGEHGDLVNEKYKKIVAPDMSCFNTTVLS